MRRRRRYRNEEAPSVPDRWSACCKLYAVCELFRSTLNRTDEAVQAPRIIGISQGLNRLARVADALLPHWGGDPTGLSAREQFAPMPVSRHADTSSSFYPAADNECQNSGSL